VKVIDLKKLKESYYREETEPEAKPVAEKPIVKEPEKSPHDLEIEKITKQSEKIKALASRLKAKNELRKAQIDSEKIEKEASKEKEVYPKVVPEKKPEDVKEDYSDSPGICCDDNLDIDETIDLELGDIEEVPILEAFQKLFEQELPPPQTKEEAEIAKTQAETEKIRAEAEAQKNTAEAEAGEGDLPPEESGGDPMAGRAEEGMPADPGSMAAMSDPMAGGMGMPGQPDPNDPMGGFGDTTAPGQDTSGLGMGMGTPQTAKTTTALGRLFILKKTYYRLAALNDLLVNNTDEGLEKIASEVSEAFDIFKLIINNLKSFKPKIDEVIILYYQFIREVAKYLQGYFAGKYYSET